MLDTIDDLKTQADYLKSQANAEVKNDQEYNNNEESGAPPTLYAQCQSPDTGNTTRSNSSADTSCKRTCLAHAIQWHSPQLITPPFSCACITQLGEILRSSNKYGTCVRHHCLYTQQKTIKLLIDIKNADFHQMERCLNVIQQYNPAAVKTVWDLSKQYQEIESDSLQCGYCKVRCGIDIKPLSVNLWRNGIISDHLFEAISTHSQGNGSAESLWKDLENELKLCTTRDNIIAAIADTLRDCYNMDKDFKAEIKRLTENENFKLSCECSKHYFDVPRLANKSVSPNLLDTDTNVSENEPTNHEKAKQLNKRRTNSRSTSTSRRKSLPTQDSKCEQYGSKSPTKQTPGEMQIERSPSWPPDNDVHVGKTITLDRKKSKVININNHGKGPVNVNNKFVKVGKKLLSDTSNDTESQKSSPYGSDSDTGHSVVSAVNEEFSETINVTKNQGHLCRFLQDHHPEFIMKTARRRRTVSESAIQTATLVETPGMTEPSLETVEQRK